MVYGSSSYGKGPSAEQSDANLPKLDSLNEHFCNLCKKCFSTAADLDGHLIEHSFQGCDERGYKCYICSSIFTLPSGLHQHMHEHGASYRPYDCNLCSKKYFFRSELENHLIEHENGRIESMPHRRSPAENAKIESTEAWKTESNKVANGDEPMDADRDSNVECIKSEMNNEQSDAKADDDDEYIEVEQIGESNIEKIENSNENCHRDDEHETGSN